MSTTTIESIFKRVNVTIPFDLLGEIEVPVLTGPQRQGDVGIFPRPHLGAAERSSLEPLPVEGVAVVRGESGGNTHWLLGEGLVLWGANRATSTGDLTLGILHVGEGAVAHLIHEDEHGCNAIGPGTYRLTGKREMADEIRRVAD